MAFSAGKVVRRTASDLPVDTASLSLCAFVALAGEVLAPRLLVALSPPVRLIAVRCPANARDNGLIRFAAINRYPYITENRIDGQGFVLRNSEILTEVKMKKPRSRSNEANKQIFNAARDNVEVFRTYDRDSASIT